MSNGNVFTDDFRSDLPEEVQQFLKEHMIKLVFKHEVNAFSDKSKGGVPKYDTLIKNLGSLCNPIVDDDFVKREDDNDVCHQYFFKAKNSRNKNFHRKKWSKRGNIYKNSQGIITNNNIGQEYLTDGLNALLISNDDKRDIIVLVDSDTTINISESEKVVGFLMTELGECNNALNDYGHVPALNLVCAPRKHVHSNKTKECATGSCSVIGRVLLFMYLFALKKKNINVALLELAGLYCNIKGLCLYNKFGFREDVSLVEESCFKETANLAMICNLDKITERELIDALILNKPIAVANSEPLCDKKFIGNLAAQINAVDIRMENYKSMLDLQTDNVTIEDVEKYINQSLPPEKKHAVKQLGILSQMGEQYKNFGELKKAEDRAKRRRKRDEVPSKAVTKGPKKNRKKTQRMTRSMITGNGPNWSFKNTSDRKGLSKGLHSGEGVIFHKRRRSMKKKYGW